MTDHAEAVEQVVSNVVSLQAPKTVVVSKDAPAGLKDVNDLHRYDPALVKTLLEIGNSEAFWPTGKHHQLDHR